MAMEGESVAEGETPEATADVSAEAPAPVEPAPAPEPEAAPPPEPSPAPAPEPVAEPGPSPEPEAEEEAKEPVGVTVDVGIATIYNFRGLNSFQESSQMDQNALFAPSLEWSIFDSGVTLGYWGAYQLTGNNKTEMVDGALGHEQDLYIGYALGLADDLLELSFAFTYFFYPFADEDVAGTGNPSIIEPLVGFSIATVIDIGFSISYFHGIQEEIETLRHAYFTVSVGKEFAFNERWGMNLGMGFGAKAWIEDVDSNRFDLLFDWSIPINLTDQLYIEPGIHLAWTDLEEVASGMDDDPATGDDESVREAHAGDEYMVYGSVNIGANF
jgi:hypothetical protein